MAHRLIGRDHDLARVTETLNDRRAAVLLGTGGVGKSALARAVAATHDGPVAWVDAESADTVDTLSEALGAALGVDVLPGEAPTDALAAVLAEQPTTLVVVDGVERLAPLIAAWAAPLTGTATWLFTSRQPLPVGVAPAVRLAPLAVDGEPAGASAADCCSSW